MKIYLVGGAVRDALLRRPVVERDWVVVGATPEAMIARGFKPVGRDFPVYLHPDTHEEYALARLERKVAPGYRGFVTEFSPSVTLEEDLQRRDLTINAMAQDETGLIIDPWGGQADLSQRRLRHVSPAFVEDPVRILRVARFLARLAPLGFSVAPETLTLMRSMIDSGEVDALVPERIWRELERLLMAESPGAGIGLLESCGAWRCLLPELPEHRFAPDTYAALERAAQVNAESAVRFAVLLHALTIEDIDRCCDRWRVPVEHRELAMLLRRRSDDLRWLSQPTGADSPLSATRLSATRHLETLEASDAFRRPARFIALLIGFKALAGDETSIATLCDRLQHGLALTRAVKLSAEETASLSGPALGERLRQKRLQVLQAE